MEWLFPYNRIQRCVVGTGSQKYCFLENCSDSSTKERSQRFMIQMSISIVRRQLTVDKSPLHSLAPDQLRGQ